MPPIDLPPDTPQDALLLDLQRPRLVISASRAFPTAVVREDRTPEGRERPHGGEPGVRLIFGTTSTSLLSSGDSIWPGTGRFTVVINESMPGSESNGIIEAMERDQTAPATHPALPWSIQHRQYRGKSV